MDTDITIPVEYKGEELNFDARVQVWQFGHRFFVPVDGVELVFERDDSGQYRALTPEGYTGKLPGRGVVQAIASVLDEL